MAASVLTIFSILIITTITSAAFDNVTSLMTTDRDCSKQIDELTKNMTNQQQQLDRLIEFVQKRNESIHTNELQRLDSMTKILEWTYYEADRTFLKAFGKDLRSTHLPWSKAREVCLGFGGDLVQIHDEDKNTFVLAMFVGSPQRDPWIGIKNQNKIGFNFTYVNGSPIGTYHPWHTGNPDGEGDDRDKCVAMFTQTDQGKWFDGGCYWNQPYVCSTSSLSHIIIEYIQKLVEMTHGQKNNQAIGHMGNVFIMIIIAALVTCIINFVSKRWERRKRVNRRRDIRSMSG